MAAHPATTDKAASQVCSQSPFSNIPREIRDIIYTHYFAGRTYKTRSMEILSPPFAYRTGYTDLSILALCRSIRIEASAFLQRHAAVRLHLSHSLSMTEQVSLWLSSVANISVQWDLTNLMAVRQQASAMKAFAPLLLSQERLSMPLNIHLILAETLISPDTKLKLQTFLFGCRDVLAIRTTNLILSWPSNLPIIIGAGTFTYPGYPPVRNPGCNVRDKAVYDTVNGLADLINEINGSREWKVCDRDTEKEGEEKGKGEGEEGKRSSLVSREGEKMLMPEFWIPGACADSRFCRNSPFYGWDLRTRTSATPSLLPSMPSFILN